METLIIEMVEELKNLLETYGYKLVGAEFIFDEGEKKDEITN